MHKWIGVSIYTHKEGNIDEEIFGFVFDLIAVIDRLFEKGECSEGITG